MAVRWALHTLGDVRAIMLGAALAFALAACSPAAGAIPRPTPAPSAALSGIDYTTPAPPPLGLITFGQEFDPVSKRAVQVRTQFWADDPDIAWSVSLLEAVAAKKLQLLVATRAASGVEKIVSRKDVTIDEPSAEVFATKTDLAAAVGRKAGTYVMRYLRDGLVIAEGTFKLVAR